MLEFSFSPFPTLTTERLILRQISSDDGASVFALRSDPHVMKYLDRPMAKTIEDALQLIQKMVDGINDNSSVTWAICLKETNSFIGNIGFWRTEKENHRAEVGYMLDKNFQGKGLMQEAITAVIVYGFESMKLHSIEANVNPANAASIKLLEKNHFVREAYYRENYYYDGQFLDSAIYSLLTPFR